jgi:hypothetical protein
VDEQTSSKGDPVYCNNTICVLGLTKEEEEEIVKYLPPDCGLYEASCMEDLIAIPSFACVVRGTAMSKENEKDYLEFLV